MIKTARTSYFVMAGLLVLIGLLNLGPLVLTSLFGYFALGKFRMGRSKDFAVAIYIIVVVTVGYCVVIFAQHAYYAMPRILETSIPAVVTYAEKHGVDLPFTDYASAKIEALTFARESLSRVGHYIRGAIYGFAQLIIGLVLAISLYCSGRWGEEIEHGIAEDNLYAAVVRQLAMRFRTFYSSFSQVIGAQIFIAAINSTLTAAFLIWTHCPYKLVLVGVTFLCGLLPIIGNLISNTLILGVSFAKSPELALGALIFLMVIHKLEYFLNSKIIGDRIRSPMWLTLVGLVIGEKLMGIPGMILAPVVLYYIKLEAQRNSMVGPGQSQPARVPETAPVLPR